MENRTGNGNFRTDFGNFLTKRGKNRTENGNFGTERRKETRWGNQRAREDGRLLFGVGNVIDGETGMGGVEPFK